MSELVTEQELIPHDAIEVLPPYGFVRLQAVCASDLDVVNAARVSFAKESDWDYQELDPESWGEEVSKEYGPIPVLKEADKKLIHFLLKGRHGTPFEHNFFKFHIRAPIFVMREWHRHRIGISYNEESARYSPLEGHFYTPERHNIRQQVGKPGHYTFETIQDNTLADDVEFSLKSVYDRAFCEYEWMLKSGIAKEIARLVLPVGIYSQMIFSCNARSLMNFLSLRNSEHAQYEIRQYAMALESEFRTHMPVTYEAFIANDRQAP